MVTFLDGGDITVSGSEALTKPGGYQFTATGGNEPYTWSVSGTGVVIDQTGYVTMGNDACGAFIVTCTDCTGRSVSHSGTRVTNNGSWSVIADAIGDYPYCAACNPWPCYCDPFCGSWSPCYNYELISGLTRKTWTQCTWCSVRGPGMGGCVECSSHWSDCASICMARIIAILGYGWTTIRAGTEIPPGSGNPGAYFMDGPVYTAALYQWTC